MGETPRVVRPLDEFSKNWANAPRPAMAGDIELEPKCPPTISLNAFVPGPRCHVRGAADGSLAGLTFAVKDLIDVAGVPTGGGNPDWERTHPVPTRHAWIVERLLRAGASVIGKTATDEISLGILGENAFTGTPLNPAAPDRVPGGSSSGSASAVAGGVCDFALGTDTGGSVRVPASFCGLFGIQADPRRASNFAGVLAQAPDSDTVGWFARDGETFARVCRSGVRRAGAGPNCRAACWSSTDAFAFADARGRPPRWTPMVDRLASLIGRSARAHSRAAGPVGVAGRATLPAIERGVADVATHGSTLSNPRFAFNCRARAGALVR
jgi:amidase